MNIARLTTVLKGMEFGEMMELTFDFEDILITKVPEGYRFKVYQSSTKVNDMDIVMDIDTIIYNLPNVHYVISCKVSYA